jgi:hypothetical protein
MIILVPLLFLVMVILSALAFVLYWGIIIGFIVWLLKMLGVLAVILPLFL